MSELRIEGNGKTVRYFSPYSKGLVADLKIEIPASARRPVKDLTLGFYWEVAAQYVDTLNQLSEKHFGYKPVVVGQFDTPTAEVHTIFLEYMGLIKYRGGDTYNATGWVDGGWNATFPIAVLMAWFHFKVDLEKDEEADTRTVYEVLGIASSASDQEVKKAYRRAARAWHPDVNHEEGADKQFRRIQEAYELIQNPDLRQKYNAFLDVMPNSSDKTQELIDRGMDVDWRPPVRCGNLKVKAVKAMGKYTIEKILAWDDIVRGDGKTMVTSWDMGAEHFKVRWA